jgi:hypothetical protein
MYSFSQILRLLYLFQKSTPPSEKKSMIIFVSKKLCLGSLRNASVVYLMVNWGLIFTADDKGRFWPNLRNCLYGYNIKQNH